MRFDGSRFLLILFLFSASCVTTREQLNQMRKEGPEGAPPAEAPARPVKSEELAPVRTVPETAPTPAVEQSAPSPTPAQVAPPFALPPSTPSPTPIPIVKPEAADYGAEELRAELARVAGLAEEYRHEKEKIEAASAETLKKSQERIAQLEKQLKDLTPEVPTLPEGKSNFQAGKDAYLAGNLDEAVHFLTQALSVSESGKEAEEATFLRAEAQFKKQQYNKAIVDYSRFPEKFQKSSYHPKALLKIAESFDALGKKEESKAFYSELVDKFPKTAEGMLAKKRLKAKP
jgi:TolA-binding protein